MEFLLILLRCLFGAPSEETTRVQPILVRKDGRLCCRRQAALPSVWLPGIGWLTLPERFSRTSDEPWRTNTPSGRWGWLAGDDPGRWGADVSEFDAARRDPWDTDSAGGRR